MNATKKYDGLEIAIIGMSGQFPQSNTHREYWQNLVKGEELIKRLTDDELKMTGVSDSQLQDHRYVKVASVVNGKDRFDTAFFGYTPDEASLMDPQIRLFHQHCWHALEDAGYSSQTEKIKIGLFAGASRNDDWKIYVHLRSKDSSLDPFYLNLITDRNNICTLVSYRLNLRGPVLFVDSACSTSLSAVHLACRSLLTRDCAMALAGGISVSSRKQKGYMFREGMITSSDGHCRPFDAASEGTVSGEGAGIVVLKRLSEAIKDRDHIYCIIKSTSANNDGNNKVGYTAPSVKGQTECITSALRLADIDPRTISYIETHGTGTRLGDPVEIKALNEAFGVGGHDKFCAIGSVKGNLGHLDGAAGIAGLIKTSLCLKYKKIPPSLHFKTPNPEIDFEGGPFYVNAELKEWTNRSDSPLRAGVTALGIGGTNVHAILEEAPDQYIEDAGRPFKLLTVSAKTPGSLTRYLDDLKNFLAEEKEINMADLSYTLQVGRRHFPHRYSTVYKDREDLLQLLTKTNLKEQGNLDIPRRGEIVFLFPGQGSQYGDMGRDLYRNEPLFREQMDIGFSIIENLTGENFKDILFSQDTDGDHINETRYTQPLVFLLEYCMARLTMSLGIIPRYMIGHSIGEYVAACISGVFTFEDALRLVVRRGKLMSSVPPGAMISISMTREEASEYVGNDISLSAVNGPRQVVLSGNMDSIDQLLDKLRQLDIPSVKIRTSHAFHSYMQDTILDAFKEEFKKVKFDKIRIPFISNLTGNFITEMDASSPEYWTRHLRETVNFSDGVNTLLSESQELIFVEVGAGHTLGSLVKQQAGRSRAMFVNLVRSGKEVENDGKYFWDKIGKLWSWGIHIDWNSYYQNEKRYKVSLPAYSFEPISYPAEINLEEIFRHSSSPDIEQTRQAVDDWFYDVQWRQSRWLPGRNIDFKNKKVLIFSDKPDFAGRLLKKLNQKAECILVSTGENYDKIDDKLYVINPFRKEEYEYLFNDLKVSGFMPGSILHTWNLQIDSQPDGLRDKNLDYHQKIGFQSLLDIARNISTFYSSDPIRLEFMANGLYDVTGNDIIFPDKSTSLGALKVIPLEFENISCRAIDLADTSDESINSLSKELSYVDDCTEVAIREKHRYVRHFEKIDFKIPEIGAVLKKKGTYLVTGANGGMGKLFSEVLAEQLQANLILIGRRPANHAVLDNLEKKGSSVFYIQADVSDAGGMAEGILQAEKIVGKINGIIHTAGLADLAGIIIRRKENDDRIVFSAKINGTDVLHSLFKDKNLDFFVNCSSHAATLPPFGQVAYVASNIYQDAFSLRGNPAYPIISIQWPPLKEVGMAVNSISHLSAEMQAKELQYGIAPSEAVRVLIGALFLKIPLQIISTVDFPKYCRMMHNDDSGEHSVGDNRDTVVQSQHRPELSTDYAAPQTETEKKLTDMLIDFLKIENIGAEDDFFELGGDSLKGLVFLRRLKKEFNINLTLRDLLLKSTIRGIAGKIDSILWLGSDIEMENEITI